MRTRAFVANPHSAIFRKNAAFLTTVFVGAFAFEMAFDTATDAVWDRINRGRQWKDIKHKFMAPPEEDE
ncbi:ubiquinol-cytochrome c reductase subunit 9 [Exophiala aquamarina CBS 119918]|uniref:Complex III subunit 9 n=1 Tax=Exophiala aquamarina CBS 119918 TaxID=1182545 RepID=A0A072PVF2_9EURO|nr:ubiquinol-cytochrome c reductase subunit 9 [Exophiala aquamarina CBS 119918]KEF63836.1 ubiquinol-cytochrome c reductase subunit 9 [Exophiala aquamarina CBS 119918]